MTAYRVDSLDGYGAKVPFLEKFVSVLLLEVPPTIDQSVTLHSILLTNISIETPLDEVRNIRSRSKELSSREASKSKERNRSIFEVRSQ